MAQDLKDSLSHCVLIAQERLRVGDEDRMPGTPVPEARRWERGFVDVTRGRMVALSPEACAEIVRAALQADPSLAQAFASAARPQTSPPPPRR